MPDKVKNYVKAIKLNVESLIGFAGFATSVAAFLSMLCEIPLLYTFSPESLSSLIGLVVFSLSLMITFASISKFAFQIYSKNCRALVILSVIGAFASVAPLIPGCSSGLLGIVFLAIIGAGVAALACLWFINLNENVQELTLSYIAVGVGSGCTLCVLFYFLEGIASSIVTTWLFSLSCTFGLIAIGLDKTKYECKITNESSDKRSRISVTSSLMLASTFFEFGFVVSFVEGRPLATTCLIAAIITMVVISIDNLSTKRITERNLAPVMPALTVFAFMLLNMDSFLQILLSAALVIITVLLVTYMSLGLTAMTQHAKLSKLSPLRMFSRVRFVDYMGFLIGSVIGYAVRTIPTGGVLIVIGLALCFCLISFLSYKSRFPESGFEKLEIDTKIVNNTGRKGWRQRCQVVGEENGLSERQLEILMILAQGRDAKYIEKKLVISLSTVQTHIRNIYRKLGVHSRQELIDMIEQTKLYGEG